jgi:hypothetical protein
MMPSLARFDPHTLPPRSNPYLPGCTLPGSSWRSRTNYRLHLRIEPDGGGVLIVNAATVLRRQTAAEYAYYLIQNTPREQIARNVAALIPDR